MSDPRKPAILQVIPELSTGGAERTAIEISVAVARAGGTALVASQGGRLLPELERAGARHILFPAATKNPARILANAARLAAIARDEGVALIHARSRAPAWSARIAARRLGLPFVTTYHGVYSQKGPLKAWYNGVMASGDVVIANSRFTAGVVRARHGVAGERLRVIPRGADLATFDPQAVDAARVAALRAAWGVAGGERILLHAARLTPWKGQALLIDAAALLAREELAGVRIVLAGDAQGRSDYEAELRNRIVAHGLADRVSLVGHCADMPAAFKAAHLAIVSPVEAEAFGRVSVEAQAMGCPVIAATSGALPETLAAQDEGRTGWLFPRGDAAALAAALAACLRLGQDELAPVRRNAIAWARAHFSIERMQRDTLEVYDALIGSALARA